MFSVASIMRGKPVDFERDEPSKRKPVDFEPDELSKTRYSEYLQWSTNETLEFDLESPASEPEYARFYYYPPSSTPGPNFPYPDYDEMERSMTSQSKILTKSPKSNRK